jgi:hypothetical protein
MRRYKKEKCMTKLKLLGAAVVLSSALAGPAMAQHVTHSPGYNVQNSYCQNREPGNPYSPDRDYQQWSAWRAEGGWDSRHDCWSESPASRHNSGF